MLGKLLRGLRSLSEPVAPLNKPVVPAVPAAAPTASTTVAVESEDVTGLPFMIRPLLADDLPHLGAVFSSAIDTLAAKDYTAQQRQVWTQRADRPDFLQALQQGTTIVAEHHGEAIAFAQLQPATHIRMLYVHPEWASLGIATLMYQYLEDEARILGADHLDTHASDSARRFFESVGFKFQNTETVTLDGVGLERHLMAKALTR